MKSYIIAETACSHDGSSNRLKKILSFAIKAGFDALQLQIWKKEKVVSKDHKDFKTLKKVEIKYQDWKKIINHIKRLSKKIDIICCVYEKESFDFCIKNNIKNFKIHSSDLGNIDFLKYVAKKSKRIDLSIGGCTKDEIIKAVSVLKKYHKCKIWLMYGIQLFPTNPQKVNLSSAKKIAKSLNLQLGYQDHSYFDFNGYALPAAAIGNGIKIIEKHVTDENKKNRTDGQSAIEIKQVAEPFILSKSIRHFEKNRIVIFAGGTGNPYFTTDTTAALRAAEIKADAIFKATKVDGVFDSDPATNDDAIKFDQISYIDVLNKKLKVMDSTALSLSMDNDIPIVVFNLTQKLSIFKALTGQPIGTIIGGK